MPYNEDLALRLRALLLHEPGMVEKKMFGGLAFMVYGNMACGIVHDDLMLRVGAARFDDALSKPHARPMDFSGRLPERGEGVPARSARPAPAMVGMVYVAPPGYASDTDLARWVSLTLAYVRTMPPKKAPAAKKPASAKVPKDKPSR